MTTSPVLIVGGRGKTGRHVTGQLQARGVAIRLASRSSRQLFDWYDESTWSAAGEHARTVEPHRANMHQQTAMLDRTARSGVG